jgi:hypothetical protein
LRVRQPDLVIRGKKWPARSLHCTGFAMAYTIPFEADAPAEHCDAAE